LQAIERSQRHQGPAPAKLSHGLFSDVVGSGGGRDDAGDGLVDGETITVHIPLTFRKRGGRKLVVTPDGAKWAPRPRVDNAMV
jgi:hypothetical protein